MLFMTNSSNGEDLHSGLLVYLLRDTFTTFQWERFKLSASLYFIDNKGVNYGTHGVDESAESSSMLKDLSGTCAFPPFVRLGGRLVPIPQQKSPCVPPLALFHTTDDMMAVILRIDVRAGLKTFPPAENPIHSLSHLISMNIFLLGLTPAPTTFWHTGCLTFRCEGLRVLGTSRMTGWGLGITEIGRTGISSPYNCSRRGYQANP